MTGQRDFAADPGETPVGGLPFKSRIQLQAALAQARMQLRARELKRRCAWLDAMKDHV